MNSYTGFLSILLLLFPIMWVSGCDNDEEESHGDNNQQESSSTSILDQLDDDYLPGLGTVESGSGGLQECDPQLNGMDCQPRSVCQRNTIVPMECVVPNSEETDQKLEREFKEVEREIELEGDRIRRLRDKLVSLQDDPLMHLGENPEVTERAIEDANAVLDRLHYKKRTIVNMMVADKPFCAENFLDAQDCPEDKVCVERQDRAECQEKIMFWLCNEQYEKQEKTRIFDYSGKGQGIWIDKAEGASDCFSGWIKVTRHMEYLNGNEINFYDFKCNGLGYENITEDKPTVVTQKLISIKNSSKREWNYQTQKYDIVWSSETLPESERTYIGDLPNITVYNRIAPTGIEVAYCDSNLSNIYQYEGKSTGKYEFHPNIGVSFKEVTCPAGHQVTVSSSTGSAYCGRIE